MGEVVWAAVDLGAESGRVMTVAFDGGRVRLEPVHRFPTGGVALGGHLYWDLLRLWQEIQAGLERAARAHGEALRSVAVDSWGVDFGLLAGDGSLLGNPVHYRDRRTDGMLDVALRRVSREELYRATGNQVTQINSLFQLLSLVESGSPLLGVAATFLNIPDLVNFFLTGRRVSERTIASTTQCYDPRHGCWATELLARLEIPTHWFCELVEPGTVLGEGPGGLSVIAGAGHDTACAVAAVPAVGRDHLFLSSGTWSIMGVELDAPVMQCLDVTNECGVAGTTRLGCNIMGLWLVQQARADWAREGRDLDYEALTQAAAAAPPLASLIVPSDPRFLAPASMVDAIGSYCRDTGQPIPDDPGSVVRCALESLALEYRRVVERLCELGGGERSVIHVVGGGSRNAMLNQMTADATRRAVVAGPAEATAVGNALVQAMALGYVGSLGEIREVVRRSFDVTTFTPRQPSAWDAAYERYLRLRSRIES